MATLLTSFHVNKDNTAYGFLTSQYPNHTYNYYMEVYLVSQDIVNNRSVIYVNAWGKSTSSSYSAWGGSAAYYVKVNGATQASGTGINFSNMQTVPLGTTGNITINHNADGTASFTASANFGYVASSLSKGEVYAQTITLPTIPRAVTITSFPAFNIDAGVTIGTNRASMSSAFRLQWGMYVGSTGIKGSINLAQDSYTFSATDLDALYGYIPNATALTVTCYLNTYDANDNFIGQTSLSSTAYVGGGIIPTLSSVTALENVTAIANLALGTNNFAQSLSNIKFTINGAAGVKSSTISTYNISFNGVNYGQNGVTGAINATGSITATATVTDSRGRTSAAKTVAVNLIAYAAPVITTFTAVRSVITITTINANAVGSISSLNSKNQLTYTVKSKLKTTGTWTTLTGPTALAVGTVSLNQALTYLSYVSTSSYDFQLTITDKIGNTAVSNIQVGTEAVAMSWSKTGIGAGKIWEQGALDVGGDMYITGRLNGQHVAGIGTGNDYHVGGFEAIGNGATNTVYPTIGFHQPTLFGGSLQQRSGVEFGFYQQGGASLANLNVSGLKAAAITVGGVGVSLTNHTHTPASIGAAASSHTHSYLPLTGGTVSGTINVNGLVFTGSTFWANASQTTRYTWADNIDHFTHNVAGSYLAIFNTNGTTYGASTFVSDEKLKKNIVDFEDDALSKIMKIKHKKFDWIDGHKNGDKGYTAQQLREVDPEFAYAIPQRDGTELLFPDIARILPALTRSIQQLNDEINNLKKQVSVLEAELATKPTV